MSPYLDENPEWALVQKTIDDCKECQSPHAHLFKTPKRNPGRPPAPIPGSALFITEAPPPAGGFWNLQADDDFVRWFMLCCLQSKIEWHADDGRNLQSFRNAGLFLIQAVKWPLVEANKRGQTAEREIIEHSATAHVSQELNCIKPRGILAMGEVAARAVALRFSESTLGRAFKHTSTPGRFRNNVFHLETNWGRVPLLITYLPTTRLGSRWPIIREDINQFLVTLDQ